MEKRLDCELEGVRSGRVEVRGRDGCWYCVWYEGVVPYACALLKL